MFKEARIMFLYTETSLHCGSGSSLGVVDLPIQREKYTEYPVCQASGVKGAVREWFETRSDAVDDGMKKLAYTFGPDFSRREGEAFAGAASFTDARLLLFPVRSLNNVFAYTTSPLALSRLRRDLETAGYDTISWVPPAKGDGTATRVQGSSLAGAGGKIVLEEYAIDSREDEKAAEIARFIGDNAIPAGNEYDFWRNKVKADLVVLPDDVFRDFVKQSTEVQARVRINDDTKTVAKGALFYEEALPSDALLYSIVMAHDPACDTDKRPHGLKTGRDVMELLLSMSGQRLQFGGDVTIGRGIVNLRFLDKNGGK
jgi:CRISPR-associated protein Cmr4